MNIGSCHVCDFFLCCCSIAKLLHAAEQFMSINIWSKSPESVPFLRKAILGEGLRLQLWNSTFLLLLTRTYSTYVLLKINKKKNLKSRINCLAFVKNNHTLGIKPIDISITHHKENPTEANTKANVTWPSCKNQKYIVTTLYIHSQNLQHLYLLKKLKEGSSLPSDYLHPLSPPCTCFLSVPMNLGCFRFHI